MAHRMVGSLTDSTGNGRNTKDPYCWIRCQWPGFVGRSFASLAVPHWSLTSKILQSCSVGGAGNPSANLTCVALGSPTSKQRTYRIQVIIRYRYSVLVHREYKYGR